MTNFEKPTKEFNYSTIDKVDWTIQDKIDNKILTMSSLTSAKLQHLQADIDDNEKSYLRIRDDNWKVIWKLNENKNVTFIDKKEVSTKFWKKVFLKIQTENTTWWVSADYMKADIWSSTVTKKTTKKPIQKKSREKENVEKPHFNYKKPQRDENWYLLPREDLKSPEEISDWYSSTKELFTKLNSITETQIEPMFKPHYFWEVNEKTGEKIPTFIIVGDVHWEQWNNKEKSLFKDIEWKKYIIENDESYIPEISAIKILHKKFWIQNIWVEWETWKDSISLIWEKLENEWIEYIEMDSEKKYKEAELNEKEILWNIDNIINISLKQYELLGIDLDNFRLTQEEVNWLNKDSIYKKMIKNPNIEPSFENIKKEIEIMKKEDKIILEKKYKISCYLLSQVPWLKSIEKYINIAKNSFPDATIDTLINEFENSFKKSQKLTKKDYEILIEDRNKYSINIMSNNLWKDKIWVMVYWKDHISDLIKQLKEKYNWKVNIYVAK